MMMRPALPLAMFAALAAVPALAAQAPDSFVYRFRVPPDGFRPDKASNEELRAYGLPPRPAAATADTRSYDAWVRAFHVARHFIVPKVKRDTRRHGLPMGVMHTGYSAMGSTNWAGEAVESGNGGFGANAFAEVMAQWVLSGVMQFNNACGGTEYSATWVGVDGIGGSTDVMQAGTEQDALCSGGNRSQDVYAWFEWYPADGFQITNFPVVTGGSVFVVLQATNATNATVTLVNLQTGDYTSTGFSAPGGTALKGDSAEWIVERPSPNGSNNPGNLADFGEVPMESEIAYLENGIGGGTYAVPGAPLAGETGYTLTMYSSTTSNTELATTVPQGTSAQLVQVANSSE